MALRKIREIGDEVLTKKCKEVKEMTPNLKVLVEDMLETMYEAEGVGLAAPQVGVLKRICVVDITEEKNQPYVFVNPTLLESDGEQTGTEGCLSIPDRAGFVTRANHIKVEAYDQDFQRFELEAEELLARAILHEMDHLDGILYVDKVEGKLYTTEELVELQQEQEEAEGEE